MPLEQAQALVERAVKVAIEKDLKEIQAKKLVEWVKAGNSPEDYDPKHEVAVSDDTNDPHASYWKNLPPNVKVTRTKRGYEVRASLAHNEGVPVVYGMMSNLEFLKGISQEPEDLQFRKALPVVMEMGKKARIAAREEAAKKEAERQAALQAKAQANVQKAEAKAQKATLRKDVKPSQSTKIKQLNAPPSAFAKEEGPITADSPNPALTKGGQGGLVEMLEQKTGLDGATVMNAVESNLRKDFKSAINTVIKQIMRRFLKRAL